jgi:hypothetical protein
LLFSFSVVLFEIKEVNCFFQGANIPTFFNRMQEKNRFFSVLRQPYFRADPLTRSKSDIPFPARQDEEPKIIPGKSTEVFSLQPGCRTPQKEDAHAQDVEEFPLRLLAPGPRLLPGMPRLIKRPG